MGDRLFLDIGVLLAAATAGLSLGVPLALLAERLLVLPRPLGLRAHAVAALTTAFLFVTLVAIVGIMPALPAYLLFACSSVVLGVVDLAEKRLPNLVVLPAAMAMALALVVAAVVTGDWSAFLSALLGCASLFVIYLVLAVISPSGLGMGDVKLALLIGLALGHLGFSTWLIGLLAGFLVGALVSLAALALRKANRSTQLPFGPSMLIGTYFAMLITI